MIKLYLFFATGIFVGEAIWHLIKLVTKIYPRRPSYVTKNEDRAYFVIYLIFVISGLLAIFVPQG